MRGQRIGEHEVLVDRHADDAGQRQFVLFELIGGIGQALLGGLALDLRSDGVDLRGDFVSDAIRRLLVELARGGELAPLRFRRGRRRR